MSNVKLSEPQKILLLQMRTRQMKLVKTEDLTWYDWQNNKGNIPYVTAKSLLNKGIFTIGSDGICNLTELGLTIEL